MRIERDPNAARSAIVATVEAAPRESKVQVFQQFCGPVTFSAGTYRAKCCRIVATCTVDAVSAVEAWERKVREAEAREVEATK